jgi:hypothetical protein
VVAGQGAHHEPLGGIVPNIATQRHSARLPDVVLQALSDAGREIGDIDIVAVTRGPGLPPCLAVGLNAAKTMAAVCGKPIGPVHHMVRARARVRPAGPASARAGASCVRLTLPRIDRPQEAHLLTARLSAPGGPAAVPFPFLCLLASGGHTILVLAKVCCGSCSAASCRCFRKVHIARGRCCSLWATTSGWEARWTTRSARLSTRWPEISECPGKWMESRHRQGRRWRHWREQVLTLPSPACCAQHASCVTAAVLSPAREYVQATPAQSSHRSRCQCERSRANAPTATSVSLG